MKHPHFWETPERESALQFLYGRIDYERTPTIPYQERSLKLERMEQLLVRLGSPHDGLRIVHVAGSKGKGSTAAMIASILSASGYRTGLYTSPHLERLEERISFFCPCSWRRSARPARGGDSPLSCSFAPGP